MLKPKFQIGSIHGRTTYKMEEKVFHPSDVPEKAKEARKEVEVILKSNKLSKNKPWDFETVAGPSKSGTKTMPWDDDGWEDRHYESIETAYLVKKAKEKIQNIREGKVIDDPSAINGRWNVSTFVEPPKTMLLISTKKGNDQNDINNEDKKKKSIKPKPRPQQLKPL